MNTISQKHIDLLEERGFLQIDSFLNQNELQALQNIKEEKNVRFCISKLEATKKVSSKVFDSLAALYPDIQFNRSIFFTKSKLNNWSVLWHQDLTICVKEKIETAGFGPWSIKEGIHHVQASPEILRKMITIRILIDDCYEDNGPLKVIPESHLKGIMDRESISKVFEDHKSHSCKGKAGSILLMKPLILHSSESSKNILSNRRVLHLEFLTEKLDNDLKLFHPEL